MGGVYEALDDKCGYLCKPKDFVAIGNRVIELLQNDTLRLQMGKYARNKVIENFTIGKFIKEYEIAYDKVMNNGVLDVKKSILIQLKNHQEAS